MVTIGNKLYRNHDHKHFQVIHETKNQYVLRSITDNELVRISNKTIHLVFSWIERI